MTDALLLTATIAITFLALPSICGRADRSGTCLYVRTRRTYVPCGSPEVPPQGCTTISSLASGRMARAPLFRWFEVHRFPLAIIASCGFRRGRRQVALVKERPPAPVKHTIHHPFRPLTGLQIPFLPLRHRTEQWLSKGPSYNT